MANAFNLEAKIELDSKDYQEGLKKASSDFGKFGTTVKEGLAKVGQISAAAVSAAAVGVGAIVKNSVSAFADYEQLAGGIETLFGENAQKVIENSEKAFKTAGLSVNEYMETSIQSAAALINSLAGDTEQAADLMDMSITDMSDNVNKMGTTMEAVQNAYRGFSRGNFTMLDNLALGFAGTKEGMQELLDKAEQLSGVKYDISSYSDIVKAIHEVQSSMGITGTTAKEAASTITGSIASTKAAWKNLTIEMAKEDGDIEKAFENLGENVGLVVDNVLPRVEKTLDGVGTLIVKAAPKISASISQVIPKIMPSLLKSATSLVGSLGKGILSAIPDLLSASKGIASDMYDSFQGSDLGVFNWLKEDVDRVVGSVKDTLKGIDFSALKDSFKGFDSVFQNIGDALGWFTEDVLSPLTTWAANDVLPDAITILSGSIDVLGAALGALKGPVWDNIIKPLAEGTGAVIAGSIDLIAKAVGGLASEFEGVDWSGYWEDIQNGDFFEDWKSGWEDISDWLSEHDDDIANFFDVSEVGSKWREFWEGVGGDVADAQERWTIAFELLSVGLTKVKDAFNGFVDAWKTGWKELKGLGASAHDSAQNSIGGILLDKLIGKIPAFGDGGYVTNPTLAVIGEKEPETIVPDSKRGEFGNTYNNFEIHIDGTGKDSQQLADELIENLSSRLAFLSISQQRALGGAGLR